ncbi:alpha/beta hydrolase [Acetobacter sacchari]|uniref:Alpha/beta hydrolase n=1 Tax=Acetobacter sacchari TaxID=2661687 RepID=A0ABS3LUK0_9PROT|nr:alpha/beta hydrolase [Acetobacter sacchari]MBO1359579.1 alpha/beta hydrolase [Acetobacter sacchari]
MFFSGFTLTTLMVNSTAWRLRSGGAGPALMLLHGRPETHAAWHAVAPAFTDTYSVICPDLHPELPPQRQAEDLLALATAMGHDRLILAGQDAGAQIACQIAALAPERVAGVIALEALPGMNHIGRDDMAYSLAQYESCWFGQLHPKPEAGAVQTPPEWQGAPGEQVSIFAPEAVADYTHMALWPQSTSSYWPQGELSLQCPLLVLWGKAGRIGGWYDPPTLWREVAHGPVSGHALDASFFLTEEAPGEVRKAFEEFLPALP